MTSGREGAVADISLAALRIIGAARYIHHTCARRLFLRLGGGACLDPPPAPCLPRRRCARFRRSASAAAEYPRFSPSAPRAPPLPDDIAKRPRKIPATATRAILTTPLTSLFSSRMRAAESVWRSGRYGAIYAAAGMRSARESLSGAHQQRRGDGRLSAVVGPIRRSRQISTIAASSLANARRRLTPDRGALYFEHPESIGVPGAQRNGGRMRKSPGAIGPIRSNPA